MRIKKLELIGFKSFKDRTVIQFDAGITGVVGPNGCGKSNIVDALLWVMGEMSAKDLRGSSMMDVIFAGSEGYSPAGMAEVSLTLENDGGPFPAKYLKHSEIMVTRRLHRNGESEYFINKEPGRLKDIQEIFMDTGAGAKGFSIIQQGMIGRMITAKPEDRKHLIEEAAGITKFKARKKESQRKLQSTEQNLVRLQDIVGELKRQIDSLQRQAQRAERYRNLKTQVEDLDLWLSTKQFIDLKTMADEAERIFNDAQALEVESGANLGGWQSELETLRLQLLEQEKSLDEKQSLTFDRQSAIQKMELEIQSLKFEIEQGRRSEQMTGNLLQESEARRGFLERDQERFNEEVTSLREEVYELKSEFESHSGAFTENQSRIQELDEAVTSGRRELFALGQSESSVEARLNSLEAQNQELIERESSEQELHQELLSKVIEFEGRRKSVINEFDRERQMQLDLSSDVESFEANRKILNEQLQEKKLEVETFKDNLNEVASRLYGLQDLANQFEGFEEGVKQVMLWQKTKQAEVMADGSVIFSPISEVVEVPAEYEMAMEAALGTRLQTLLSPNSGYAVEAIDFLKANKGGRSSFLLEGEVQKQRTAAPKGPEVKALLKDVVNSAEKFQPTVQFLLDGVAVVENLSQAIQLRVNHPDWTFVTTDGDTLTSEGILTGGNSEGVESGVLKRRREIKELSQRKDEWAGKLALAQLALKKVEEQLASVTNDFEGAQKRKIEQEIKVATLKKDLERAENEVAQAQAGASRQEREVLKISEQLNSQNQKLEELRTHLIETKAKKEAKEIESQELEEELATLRLGFEGLQNKVTELQVNLATKTQALSGAERQLDQVEKSLAELNSQLSRMTDEVEKTATELTDNQIALEERKVDFDRSVTELENLRLELSQEKNQFEITMAQVREKEEALQSLMRATNDRQHRMNEAQLKLEQAKMKEQYLVDQIRERYLLNLPDLTEKYADRDGDMKETEAQIKDLRDKLGKIGDVNLSAIEEYEETSKRYEFLTQQQADLTEAKEELKKVIDRINRICARRFRETFDLVNERFTRVFPVLFGGGEAKLELFEDPEKGEMGIEIIAKPPGKKMQNVSLLSGGEKALTAVALVFSIFLVKPSPYCLLDEVDAPLDDANVFRFNDLVREMAKRSQIIVVTHNKHTMEVAGKLYGVTMQERGVSTMVSVSLQDLT